MTKFHSVVIKSFGRCLTFVRVGMKEYPFGVINSEVTS